MSTQPLLNQILLKPTDVLFFRDGRPMTGASTGCTAAWPLPDIINHAIHAALHRADFNDVHHHRQGQSGGYSSSRTRKFGSVTTAGPFPVRVTESKGKPQPKCEWFFPRPKDAQLARTGIVTLKPVLGLAPDCPNPWTESSLPKPLKYAVANTLPPDKESAAEPWISVDVYQAYLAGTPGPNFPAHYLWDDDIADTEYAIGIAIDPATSVAGHGTTKGMIYSAHYLRLRDDFRLGVFAQALDKLNDNPTQQKRDLIKLLLDDKSHTIIVGGQQRLCTAERSDAPMPLPLPQGLNKGFSSVQLGGRKYWLVKWVLLTPAIWPEIEAGISKRGTIRKYHPGGWLPNWICPETGRVLLEAIDEQKRRERRLLNYSGKGYESAPNIDAWLVAAIVPRPIVVTGWRVPGQETEEHGGAKSTHLAVPAGAVYYFQAESEEAAQRLASVLNWHGTSPGSEIKNRRSTLLGEKGYGLGVCGKWDFYAVSTLK